MLWNTYWEIICCGKNNEENELSLREIWKIWSPINIPTYTYRSTRGVEREKEEKIFKKTMIENSQNVLKSSNLQSTNSKWDKPKTH